MKDVVIYTADEIFSPKLREALQGEALHFFDHQNQIRLGYYLARNKISILIVDASAETLASACQVFQTFQDYSFDRDYFVLRVLLVPEDGSTYDTAELKVDMVEKKTIDMKVFADKIQQRFK